MKAVHLVNSTATWLHVVVIAAVYAIVLFLAGLTVDVLNAQFTSVVMLASVPFAVILGAWAALGQGSTSLRLIVFSLLGPHLFLVYILGFIVNTPSDVFFFGGQPTVFRFYTTVVSVALPICVATQIPFWFARLAFGWQFRAESHRWQSSSVSLRDLMLLTAVFAIAISLPRFAAETIFDSVDDGVKVGNTEYVESDTPNEFGDLEFGPVEVTEENIEEIRQSRRAQFQGMQTGMQLGVILYGAFVAFLSLLYAPAIWLCLRAGSTVAGVLGAIAYLAILSTSIFGLIAVVIFPDPANWGGAGSYVFIYCSLFSVAGVVPLAISRRLGIRLVTRKSQRKSAPDDPKLKGE